MQEQFTPEEVYGVVLSLAKHKTSGPDGLPNEFLQAHWMDLRLWVMNIFDHLFQNTLDLREINKANIVMIPKKKPLRW